MRSPQEHYASLLARHYTWMIVGDLAEAAHRQVELLSYLGVTPVTSTAVAIDLGCGPGPQSLALAQSGFARVVAVDTDAGLLDELRAHVPDRSAIHLVHGDALEALEVQPGHSSEAVLCMGDTVTHLPSRDAVRALISSTRRVLAPGGRLVLTYRDLTPRHVGEARIIPVRSSDEKIMLCVLDDVDEDTLAVRDVVYTRTDAGWRMTVSSYPKLRLSPGWLAAQITEHRLDVVHHEPDQRGLWATVARAPRRRERGDPTDGPT